MFSFKTVSTLICAAALSLPAYGAGVVTKTFQGEGEGPTRAQAIELALEEVLGKATGVSLKSVHRSSTKTFSASATFEDPVAGTKDNFQAELRDGQGRDAQASVSGKVKSYQVLDVSEIRPGVFKANIEADVSVYEAGQQSERQRIAVLPFEAVLNEVNPRVVPYAERLRQGTVDYLTSTRHFAVLDRDFTGSRLSELAGLLRKDAKVEDRARLGNSLGADFIIVGRITKFDVHPQKEKIPFVNEIREVWKGSINIAWRVIEAATGQVLVSESEDLPVKFKNEEALTSNSAEKGKAIGEKITNIIFPIPVLDYANGLLTIGRGGSGIRKGEEYTLVRYGKLLQDPYTGESGARDEIPVGRVKITDVAPKISHAKVLECAEELKDLAPREFILRAEEELPAQEKPTKIKSTKTMTPAW